MDPMGLERVVFHFLGDGPSNALLVAAHFISSKEKLWETNSVLKLKTTPGAKGVMWVKQTIPQMTIFIGGINKSQIGGLLFVLLTLVILC